MSIEDKLTTMSLTLPTLPPSKGIYKHVLELNGLLYTSGHVSLNADGSLITGKLGNGTMTEEQGQIAARQCALGILASIKNHFGSLNRVKRVVKIFGMVNSTSDYTKHPIVINGASQLFVDLLGDDLGKGVRSAVGVASLPGNCAVEIEGNILAFYFAI
jgi:enamine deaminase RidA (YjgF/YER057c/UK114 family)